MARRVVPGLAAIAILSAVGVFTGPPVAANTTLAPADLRLQKTADSPLLDDLDAALPNVSVPTVVADGNRVATSCSPPATHRVAAFCWNSGDNSTPDWYPQAITTTYDAYSAGTYEGATAVVTSWYDHAEDGIDKGVRLSFVDWSAPSSPTYRHVLLVEPYTRSDGKASFRAVNIHAGGMFWYGYYLYVADTSNGFRVFDMRHIWRVTTGDKNKIGLQSDGTYHAHDYKYVLPQAFRYLDSTTNGVAQLRFSFASLDRTSTPDSVIVGEYGNPGSGTRLVRFPIDYTNRLLKVSADGYVHATEAHTVSVTSMQGATAVDGKFHISTSDGQSNKGDYATFVPGGSVRMYTDTLPVGTEDLSYWGPRDQMWGLSEYPNQRNVFAIRASSY
ncbi:MAG TPA: hypothetical protein VI076_14380 [Actinopolymorphaceae bacterium]